MMKLVGNRKCIWGIGNIKHTIQTTASIRNVSNNQENDWDRTVMEEDGTFF